MLYFLIWRWNVTTTSQLSSFVSLSPAHGVVVLRVAEAGGFQLAAHNCAGALISCQVALQSTLAVHTRPWDHSGRSPRKDKRKDIRPWIFMFAQVRSKNIPHFSTFFDYIATFSLFGCWTGATSWWHIVIKKEKKERSHLLFLTVLLHALSVPRSLSPERNYRLGFSLVVQGLHAACSIGTVREEAELELEHDGFFNIWFDCYMKNVTEEISMTVFPPQIWRSQ